MPQCAKCLSEVDDVVEAHTPVGFAESWCAECVESEAAAPHSSVTFAVLVLALIVVVVAVGLVLLPVKP